MESTRISEGLPPRTPNRDIGGNALVPGVNVDALDIPSGMKMYKDLGYGDNGNQTMMVNLALQKWAKGEEEQAEKMAIGIGVWKDEKDWPKINLMSWRMILAAAMAGAEAKAKEEGASEV